MLLLYYYVETSLKFDWMNVLDIIFDRDNNINYKMKILCSITFGQMKPIEKFNFLFYLFL